MEGYRYVMSTPEETPAGSDYLTPSSHIQSSAFFFFKEIVFIQPSILSIFQVTV